MTTPELTPRNHPPGHVGGYEDPAYGYPPPLPKETPWLSLAFLLWLGITVIVGFTTEIHFLYTILK